MTWVIVAIIVGLVLIWFLLRSRGGGEPFRSLIVLLHEPRLVGADHVSMALSRADLKGAEVTPGMPVRIKHADGDFYVGSMPTTYTPPGWTVERLASQVREARLQEAVLEHKAWFSVVIERIPENSSPEQAYAFAGKLIAELIDDSCLALWSAETNHINLITPELLEACRQGRPLDGLSELRGDEVSNIDSSDRRMAAAIEEARERWPEFVAAFPNRKDPNDFIVKFPFTEGESTEHMWIQVESIQGDHVTGTLLNKPFHLRGWKEGQRVERPASELTDWAYISESGPVGAFSEAIVRGG